MSEKPELDGAHEYAALVRALLQDLSGTSITSLELRQGDLRVGLRRQPGLIAAASTGPSTGTRETLADAHPAHWHVLEAPLTGLYYSRPAPNEDTYVTVGGHVDPDQVVGLIESMKMFNEVTADVSGTVRECPVENGALIEAGQPILYIEPDEDASVAPEDA